MLGTGSSLLLSEVITASCIWISILFSVFEKFLTIPSLNRMIYSQLLQTRGCLGLVSQMHPRLLGVWVILIDSVSVVYICLNVIVLIITAILEIIPSAWSCLLMTLYSDFI